MALTTASTGWFSKFSTTEPGPSALARGFASAVGCTNWPVPVLICGSDRRG